MLLNELESVYLKVLLFWSCSNYYPQEQSETDMCQESAFYESPSPPTYAYGFHTNIISTSLMFEYFESWILIALETLVRNTHLCMVAAS